MIGSELQKLQQLFRWNASLRHGVPVAELLPSAAPAAGISSPMAPPQQTAEPLKNSITDMAGRLAVAAVLGTGIGATGMALYDYFAKPVAEVVTQPEGSLLQYLEDQGLHRLESQP